MHYIYNVSGHKVSKDGQVINFFDVFVAKDDEDLKTAVNRTFNSFGYEVKDFTFTKIESFPLDF